MRTNGVLRLREGGRSDGSGNFFSRLLPPTKPGCHLAWSASQFLSSSIRLAPELHTASCGFSTSTSATFRSFFPRFSAQTYKCLSVPRARTPTKCSPPATHPRRALIFLMRNSHCGMVIFVLLTRDSRLSEAVCWANGCFALEWVGHMVGRGNTGRRHVHGSHVSLGYLELHANQILVIMAPPSTCSPLSVSCKWEIAISLLGDPMSRLQRK